MSITQAEFARRRNVSRARVNQWIKAGKIYGPALVDGGLDEALACEQLKVKLDIDQRIGNGLETTLDLAPRAGDASPALAPTDSIERRIQLQKLEQLQRVNRQAQTDEAIANGLLCDTAAARQATAREVARVIARVEGSLTELASALAAKFKLAHRDVLHELRGEWRKIRQNAAIEARERGEPMPEMTGYELGDT